MLKSISKNNIFFRNRFALCLFIFSVVYSVAITNRFKPWEVDDYAMYSFCSVDFSYGFATKLLPGAIFNAIFGANATRENATVFMSIIVLLIFAGVSVLLQKFLKKIPTNERPYAFILAIMFLTGAYTFSIFTKTLGVLDTYWVLFTVIFFLILENKYLKFLIPLLFAGCIFVHNASIVSYIVLMSIVLLYKISRQTDKKQKIGYIFILAVSLGVAIGLFLFFSLKEADLVCSIEDFHKKLLSHGSDCFYYYDYAFFDIYQGEQYIPDFVSNINSPFLKFLYVIFYRVNLNIKVVMARWQVHLTSFILALVILLPLVLLFISFHKKRMKTSSDLFSKIIAVLMILQFPFTLLTTLPFSEDITRQFTHSFLIAFTTVLIVIYYDKKQSDTFFETFKRFADTVWCKIYFMAYVSVSVFTIV